MDTLTYERPFDSAAYAPRPLDLPRYRIEFPPPSGQRPDQHEAYFYLADEDERSKVRFHDYGEIYRRPGLYEQLFYDRLKCKSPRKVADVLRNAVLKAHEAPSELRVLDLGAGNGMVGEVLAQHGVSRLVGVDIIEEAVIPVPEAGYALLHAQQVEGQMQVECGRFAWNPAAARVELISPDDLLVETVRRRAVFHWTHTIRPGRGSAIAIQKITNTGSTHFPLFGVDDE